MAGLRGPIVAYISYITKNTLKIYSMNVKMGQILFMLWTMMVVCVFIGVALGEKTQHQHTRHPRTLMAWKSLGLANLVLVTLSNKFSLLVVHHLLFHQEIHLHPSRNHCFMIIHYKVTEPLHWIWKYVVYICGSWRLSGLGAYSWYYSLVTTATTGGGVLFSSRCPFLHRERKILAYLGPFVTNIWYI